MTEAKIWKLKGGRYGGITARGKRFIESSREAALRRIGRSSSKKSRTKSKRVSAKKGGRRRVAKGKSLVQTAYKLIPVGALIAPGVAYAFSGMGPRSKIVNIVRVYTGYHIDNKRWRFNNLLEGWMPFLGASVAVLGIRKLRGLLRRG